MDTNKLNTIYRSRYLLTGLILITSCSLYAQERKTNKPDSSFNELGRNFNKLTATSHKKELSLNEAIALARQQNKWIETAKMEELASREDKKDARLAALPQLQINASYQRFSKLAVFKDGLGDVSSMNRYPTANQANAGIEGAFTIYGGGRINELQLEQSIKSDLASLNTQDQTGNISLQTAAYYLDLMRLNDLKKFITDQEKRAELRLKNINAFYRNQKVTRSDVLRAEVMLSNVSLNLIQTENDISITSQKLEVLLNLPKYTGILTTDTFDRIKPQLLALSALLDTRGETAFSVLKADKTIGLQQSRLNLVKSNNLPALSFFTAYGLNYPNYLLSPPTDQLYAIGFVGIKAQYNISSLYHNKAKKAAAKWRLEGAKIQKESVLDNTQQEIESYYIKYMEALNRIDVNEKSIKQAEANYKITSTKYFNQLALLTDLLDADYLFQESRFNLIKAQADAIMIYYRMLYAAGKL